MSMSLSVNTNPGALIALQNLTNTESQLQVAQNQVSTGLAVASASDNGAIYAIAQNQRSTSSALTSVTQSLQRVQSTVNVATSAGSTVSDLLNQLKAAALSASDTSTNTASRAALNATFTSLLSQIKSVVSNSSFNGVNLIDGSVTSLAALASADGKSKLTVSAQSLALGGANITVAATTTITTATAATAALALVDTSITNVNNALAKLGASENALQTQITFTGTLQDTIDTGIGNLVNANLAKESATLTALQTKQSLGIQALSIANSSSQSLLQLFR
jgi:flagellin